MEHEMEGNVALYVVAGSADGPCKIGIASNPTQRLAALQTGYPQRLEFHSIYWFRSRLSAKRAERIALDHFRSFRMFGEWLESETWHVCGQLYELLDRNVQKHIVSIELLGPIDPPDWDSEKGDSNHDRTPISS